VSRISWQVIQNSKVFVISIPVFKPPQKMMPDTKEMDEMAKSEYFALGFFKVCQIFRKKPVLSLVMGMNLWVKRW
jgi:hypothetical protein